MLSRNIIPYKFVGSTHAALNTITRELHDNVIAVCCPMALGKQGKQALTKRAIRRLLYVPLIGGFGVCPSIVGVSDTEMESSTYCDLEALAYAIGKVNGP